MIYTVYICIRTYMNIYIYMLFSKPSSCLLKFCTFLKYLSWSLHSSPSLFLAVINWVKTPQPLRCLRSLSSGSSIDWNHRALVKGPLFFFWMERKRTVGKKREKSGQFFLVEDFLLLKNMRAFWGRESDIMFFWCNLRWPWNMRHCLWLFLRCCSGNRSFPEGIEMDKPISSSGHPTLAWCIWDCAAFIPIHPFVSIGERHHTTWAPKR